jgi:predicted HD phosphohydrolase
MSELIFTCQNRHLCDVIDLYVSELAFTCNRRLRDVVNLYMSELTFTS